MKDLTTILLIFTHLFVLSTGCKKDPCLKSIGTIVKEKREVQAFTSVALYNKINLTITQDTVHTLEVEAGENIMPFITTELVNGTLVIRDKNRCDFLRSYKTAINVYISVLNLDSIYFNGSGIIKGTNKITSPRIIIDCWNAAGSVIMDLVAGRIIANLHSGAADVTLSGISGEAYLYSASSGWLFADKLEASYCDINNSGTGDISIRVVNWIGVQIKSLGSVYYSGNPAVFSQKISGTGKFVKQ